MLNYVGNSYFQVNNYITQNIKINRKDENRVIFLLYYIWNNCSLCRFLWFKLLFLYTRIVPFITRLGALYLDLDNFAAFVYKATISFFYLCIIKHPYRPFDQWTFPDLTRTFDSISIQRYNMELLFWITRHYGEIRLIVSCLQFSAHISSAYSI